MLIECEHQPFLRITESLNLTSQGGRSLGWVRLPYSQRFGAYESLHIHCLILSTNSETRQELSLIPLYRRKFREVNLICRGHTGNRGIRNQSRESKQV